MALTQSGTFNQGDEAAVLFNSPVDPTGLRVSTLLTASIPAVTKRYRISGNSNGDPWSWRIDIGGTTVASAMVGGVNSVPGEDPWAFAEEFRKSINAQAAAGTSGCTAANELFPSDRFTLACPDDFEFFVDDQLVDGSGVSFNPTIQEVALPVFAPTVSWGEEARSSFYSRCSAFLPDADGCAAGSASAASVEGVPSRGEAKRWGARAAVA